MGMSKYRVCIKWEFKWDFVKAIVQVQYVELSTYESVQ